MSKVQIIDTSYEMFSIEVDKIFKEFPLKVKGKRVFVKPNILGGFPPERGVTTHPKIVEGVVDYLLKNGAHVVVGDNTGTPRAYGKNEGAAKTAGIFKASKGCFENIGRNSRRVKTSITRYPEISVSSIVLDCDLFISLPKFKTHLNTIITGGLKNSYGIIAGAEKTHLHGLFPEYRDFAHVIVEVFKIRKPDLVIMDAVVGMEGDGPSSPDLRKIGKVIASDDAVSIDTVMCHMMGADPKFVNLLQICRKQKIGETDLSKIKIIGDLSRIPRFKLPVTYKNTQAKDSFVGRVISRVVRTGEMRLNKSKCIMCRQCCEVCPVKAISMKPFPEFNRERCIMCFCCKEVCPNNAISVGGAYGMLRRVLK